MKRALLICVLFSFCSLRVFGCIYNVRDMGFVDIVPNSYRLYYFIQNNTPEKTVSAFKQISYASFMDSNIKVEIINIDYQKDHPALEYIHFWELKSFPAAILMSPTGRSYVIPVSVPGKKFKETMRSSLESIVSSPIREEILSHTVKAYCVVLVFEGKNAAENKRVHDTVTNAAWKIARIMSQLPKRIEEPPHIIVIPQKLISREKMLLWSLGIYGNQINEPHVAVTYGKGRRIGPVLKGKQISANRLVNILSIIGLSCECGLDKQWIMGPLLPLRWGEDIQSDVVKFLGFDAESPMIKTEMSNIMSLDFFRNSEEALSVDNLRDVLDKYSEELFKFQGEPDTKRFSPAKFQELVSQESANSRSGLNLKMILFITGSFVLLILGVGAFILVRARKKFS